jgi:hypothetical protein
VKYHIFRRAQARELELEAARARESARLIEASLPFIRDSEHPYFIYILKSVFLYNPYL